MADPDLVGLCRALGLGDAPEAVLTSVYGLYAEWDRIIAAGAEGLDLPCRAGCSACCHEAVFVSAPEFFAVAAFVLRSFERPARADLVAEMATLAETFADELELLEALPKGPERDEVAMRVRFRCPMLSADERCRVYAARELNGRTFGLTVDDERGHPYGCELTHQRLRIVSDAARNQGTAPGRADRLASAREARRALAAMFPDVRFVHVYPWWFGRYGDWLVQ